MPAEAGFGGCYVSIITLDIHKNNIKSNRDILQNHDISLRDNQENIAAVVTDNRLASLHKARVYGLGVYY